MRWLIRRVIKKGKGSVSYEEDVHFGDVLTIGRGSDQAIFIPDLRVALDHAKVTALGNGQYKIESLILAGIRVNNDITYATTVGPGAIVEIGTTRIQLLEPPVDHDAGVEVSTIDKAELKALKDAKALPTSLAQTWLSKRRPSWIVFTLVALLFVGLPLAAHFTPTFRKVLHDIPGVPSQDQWQAGDLAPAHHYFGSECTTCHQVPFRWVKDEACAKCHAGTPAHADPVKFNLPELGDARCAHCHRDHNGPNGLVIQDQVLCADCHHDLKARTKNASALVDVGDFAAQHPEFQIDLPAWDANGNFKTITGTRISQDKIGASVEATKSDRTGEIQLTNGLRELLKSRPIYACEVKGVRHDTGNKLGFLKAVVYFAMRRPDLRDKFAEYLGTLGLNLPSAT